MYRESPPSPSLPATNGFFSAATSDTVFISGLLAQQLTEPAVILLLMAAQILSNLWFPSADIMGIGEVLTFGLVALGLQLLQDVAMIWIAIIVHREIRVIEIATALAKPRLLLMQLLLNITFCSIVLQNELTEIITKLTPSQLPFCSS